MISTALLAALLVAPAPSRTGGVAAMGSSRAEITGTRALGLAAKRPEPRPAGPHAVSRRVVIERSGDRARMRAVWTLDGPREGAWFAATVVRGAMHVRSVTIDGRPAAAIRDGDATMFAAWVDGARTVELVGDLTGDAERAPIELELMPAVRGTATITGAPTWRLESNDADGAGSGVVATGDRSIGGGAAVRVVARPPEAPDASVLVVGRVGVGLSIGEAELRGAARLQWVVRRGELARVSFRARHTGDDIEIRGRDVREVRRTGDLFEVELQAPVSSVVALDATWTARTPPGEAELRPPVFELDAVTRTETSFELGRDGDIDVAPRMDTWRQVAAAALPVWGRDLVDGASAAAWVRHDGRTSDDDRLQLLRFVPVEAPAVVVAKAEIEASSAAHGTTLVKARYEVVNERASHLRVRLAKGSRLLAVEVFGADADVARDDDVFLVPIPRSLETLEGLISIPVVVTVLVDQPAWRRRDRRELPLPEIDAPIRSIDAEWRLPRDVHATIEKGESGVTHVTVKPRPRRRARMMSAASIAVYDFADDAPAARKNEHEDTVPRDEEEAEAEDELADARNDRLLSEAQSAYTANDFAGAQAKLDELRAQGGASEDVGKLQSNLDIVNAPVEPMPAPDEDASISMTAGRAAPAKTGLLRRIKDQARARGQKQAISLQKKKAKAKELRAKGEYKAAEAEYRRAIEDAKQLDRLEQDEAAVYDFEAEQLEAELEGNMAEASNRAAVDAPAPAPQESPPPPPPPPADEASEHGFGASWFSDAAFADEPAIDPAMIDDVVDPVMRVPPLDDGPRVLMPRRTSDSVHYTFDLWAPGKAATLVMKSRRRLRRS